MKNRDWKEQAQCVMDHDPACHSLFEARHFYPMNRALKAYDIAHEFYLKGRPLIARAISEWARRKTGIEIHPGAKIGRRFFIDHGMGVVIGETAEIGDDCTMFHSVTLGGRGGDSKHRHPILGDNVYIGTHATLLGPIHIGDGAKIGAGAVVLHDVPAGATAVGVPAHILFHGEENEKEKVPIQE